MQSTVVSVVATFTNTAYFIIFFSTFEETNPEAAVKSWQCAK